MVVQVQVVRQVVVVVQAIFPSTGTPTVRSFGQLQREWTLRCLPIIHERPFTDVRWDHCVVAHSGALTYQFRAELQFWRCGLTSALDQPDMC